MYLVIYNITTCIIQHNSCAWMDGHVVPEIRLAISVLPLNLVEQLVDAGTL